MAILAGMNDCIFCKIAAGEVPAEKVYEDDLFVAFLDRNPINPGHTLIIPKEHVDHFSDIPQPLYGQLFDLVKRIAPILKEVMGSARTGLAIEGFGVAHAHIHLVPINHGNELNPERARLATSEELREIGEKIRKEFV